MSIKNKKIGFTFENIKLVIVGLFILVILFSRNDINCFHTKEVNAKGLVLDSIHDSSVEALNLEKYKYYIQIGCSIKDNESEYYNKKVNGERDFLIIFNQSAKCYRYLIGPFSNKNAAREEMGHINLELFSSHPFIVEENNNSIPPTYTPL